MIRENGHVDEFVYTPYFNNSKIKFTKKDKLMRKPNRGMISYLFKKWDIDKKSLIVGDKESDEKLAKNCKIKYFDNTKNQKLLDYLKKHIMDKVDEIISRIYKNDFLVVDVGARNGMRLLPNWYIKNQI